MDNELWVLEWSQKTNNFHIQKLKYTLANNQLGFMENRPLNDYHVLFVGEKEACHQMAENQRSKLKDRSNS